MINIIKNNCVQCNSNDPYMNVPGGYICKKCFNLNALRIEIDKKRDELDMVTQELRAELMELEERYNNELTTQRFNIFIKPITTPETISFTLNFKNTNKIPEYLL